MSRNRTRPRIVCFRRFEFFQRNCWRSDLQKGIVECLSKSRGAPWVLGGDFGWIGKCDQRGPWVHVSQVAVYCLRSCSFTCASRRRIPAFRLSRWCIRVIRWSQEGESYSGHSSIHGTGVTAHHHSDRFGFAGACRRWWAGVCRRRNRGDFAWWGWTRSAIQVQRLVMTSNYIRYILCYRLVLAEVSTASYIADYSSSEADNGWLCRLPGRSPLLH